MILLLHFHDLPVDCRTTCTINATLSNNNISRSQARFFPLVQKCNVVVSDCIDHGEYLPTVSTVTKSQIRTRHTVSFVDNQ